MKLSVVIPFYNEENMIQKMYPAIATAIPIYLVMRKLQLIDTLPALIIMNTSFNLPLVIWLMMGFFSQVPVEMEESARIDGCSFLTRFFYVVFHFLQNKLLSSSSVDTASLAYTYTVDF